MTRMFLGVIAGFVGWAVLWFGAERVLSAISPTWFGAQQQAFQAAIENDGQFNADTTFLLTHLACAAIVSALAGLLAAIIAGENKRAPFILGFLMLALGLLKAAMSWAYVPIWYHAGFAAILVLLTILGAKLTRVRN